MTTPRNLKREAFAPCPNPYRNYVWSMNLPLDNCFECLLCPAVKLSLRSIEYHAWTEHSICRRKYIKY